MTPTILLTPDSAQPSRLKGAYDQAFSEAVELYIASAFLMDWSDAKAIGSQCERLRFFVGRDLGLTRKKAMLDVLKWIPKGRSFLFKAVSGNGFQGGFHPKLIFWKTAAGKFRCIVGSANLSKAGFSSNYEANVVVDISGKQFEELASWLLNAPSVRITKDWINHHYKERKLGPFVKKVAPIKPDLPTTIKFKTGPWYSNLVRERRSRQAVFKTLEPQIRSKVRACANGRVPKLDFWNWFWGVWGAKTAKKWRFQGKGVQISGKRANWPEACKALITILDAAPSSRTDELDQVVTEQLEKLSKSHNAVRKAWFSEMLCHFFPDLYPVENDPVRLWLKKIRWKGTPGLTWGNRYVELADQLREVVEAKKPAGARNLAELDTVIWAQSHKPKGKVAKPQAKPASVAKAMAAGAS